MGAVSVFLAMVLIATVAAVPSRCRIIDMKEKPASFDDSRLREEMHVAVSADLDQIHGLVAVARSLFQNSVEPDRVRLWLFVRLCDLPELLEQLRLCMPFRHRDQVTLVEFPDSIVRVKPVLSEDDLKAHGKLDSLYNYIRFYLSDLLPEAVHSILYIDADTIILADVLQLHRLAASQADHCIHATSQAPPSRGYSRELADAGLLRSPGLNAGVIYIDLPCWRANNLTASVEYWMERRAHLPIYELGSQPPLYLALGGRFDQLDPRWHVSEVGCPPKLGYLFDRLFGWQPSLESQLATAKLIHWNGLYKPWFSRGIHREYWLPYQCPSLPPPAKEPEITSAYVFMHVYPFLPVIILLGLGSLACLHPRFSRAFEVLLISSSIIRKRG